MYKHEFNIADAKPIKDTPFATVTCKLCGETARFYTYTSEFIYQGKNGNWVKEETECSSPHAKKRRKEYTRRDPDHEKPASTVGTEANRVYRHKFVRRNILAGEKSVIETCACGVSSKRYETGVRLYFDGNHYSTSGIVPPCPVGYIPERFASKDTGSRHKFNTQAIPIDEIGVTEFCECGVESFRYKTGGRKYMVDGKWTTKTPECTRKHAKVGQEEIVQIEEIKEDDIPMHEVEEIVEENTSNPDVGFIHVKHDHERSIMHVPQLPNDIDRFIIEKVIVIMRALYEDSVIHGLDTNSRKMAGRLLYSDEYEELVKKLQIQ